MISYQAIYVSTSHLSEYIYISYLLIKNHSYLRCRGIKNVSIDNKIKIDLKKNSHFEEIQSLIKQKYDLLYIG